MKENRQDKTMPSKSKKRFNQKWLIMNICLGLVFAGILFIGYYLTIKKSSTVIDTSEYEKTSQYKTISNAQKLADTGDIEGAADAFSAAAKSTDDVEDKANLTLSKASVYYNDGDYENALTIAKEAEAIKETYSIASFIAETYKNLDDLDNAKVYYQKTVSLLDKTNSEYSNLLKYYQNKIAKLNEE